MKTTSWAGFPDDWQRVGEYREPFLKWYKWLDPGALERYFIADYEVCTPVRSSCDTHLKQVHELTSANHQLTGTSMFRMSMWAKQLHRGAGNIMQGSGLLGGMMWHGFIGRGSIMTPYLGPRGQLNSHRTSGRGHSLSTSTSTR
jgi:hypothetical protein